MMCNQKSVKWSNIHRSAVRCGWILFLCAGVGFLIPRVSAYQDNNRNSNSSATPETVQKKTPANGVPSARINDALKRAGDNKDAIQSFLDSYDKGSEEYQAAQFLTANMPTVDLVSLSTDELRENMEYAFKARRELPWVRDLPFNLFLHYVLPHRVTQESYEPWRRQLFEELAPVLKGCTNMTEAAIAVNRWCGQRVKFKQTEFRDQNVMSTLRSGIGRCEEEMIVTIDAMRAVGIPARACSTPWWVVNDNNHAWVEVWTDGDWHYLGGCEPSDRLDQGWFSGAAQRAGTVISQSYGSPDEYPTGEVISRDLNNMALINSTSVYAMTGKVEIVVLDQQGNPVADCPVSTSVFNYGGLRPLLVQRTDTDGRAVFVMGLGDYFFAAGNDTEGRAHEVITTNPGKSIITMFHLQNGDAPEETFWLRYPTAAEARRWAAKRKARDKGLNRNTVNNSGDDFKPVLPEPTPLDLYAPDKDANLESIIEGSPDADAWRAILADARANWRSIAAGLENLSGNEALLDDAFAFMSRTTKLDRLEITPQTIEDHVRGAAPYRDLFSNKKLYEDDVLNGRIGYEHLTPWRSKLAAELGPACKSDNALKTAQALNAWIADNITDEERNRLGPTMNPGQVLDSRHANHREKVIFAVGALRVFGIPAKTNDTGDRVEFYDGTNWRNFDPGVVSSIRLIGDETDVKADNPESNNDSDIAIPSRVRIHLMRDGKPLGSSFHGLDIAKFHNGSWAPLRDYGYETTEDGTHNITVPPGEYLVTAGVRNPNGDPYIHTKLINLKPGDDMEISWALDLPENSGIFRFPIARKLASFPENITVKNQADDSTIDLTTMVKESPVLLYFFRMDDEPSIRMIEKVNNALPALEKVGVKVIGIALPSATDASLTAFLKQHHAAFTIVEGSAETGKAFGLEMTQPLGLFRPMPSVLLMQRGGAVVLWVEGFNLNLDRLLMDASRQIN